MAKLEINPKSSALLVMDCQVNIIDSLVHSEREKLLTNLKKAIGVARRIGIPVIYVVVRFREGYPEISSRNALFGGLKEAGRLQESASDTAICEEIKPQPSEVIVTKKRISAFTGSDLEVILRSMGIDTLVLAGVSSLGVVESTARLAFDLDYRLFVLGDCCSDRDPQANEIALTWLLPRITTVCSTEDFIAAVSQ